MTITHMQPHHYPDIYDLWARTPGMGLRELDDSQEGVERFLQRNTSTSFVMLDDDALVGIILCGHDGRRGHIYHLCVDDAYRGQGLGRELVQHALAALAGEGICKASLVCFKDNLTGTAFWQMAGWTLRDDLHYFDFVLNAHNR